MATDGDDTTATSIDPTTRVRVRASSSPSRRAPGPGAESAIITAEIPAVDVRPRPSPTHSAADPRRRSGPTSRIESAPMGLRLSVWILVFLVLLALLGLAVVHFHPTWLSFLRNDSSSLGSTPGSTAGLVSHMNFGLLAVIAPAAGIRRTLNRDRHRGDRI